MAKSGAQPNMNQLVKQAQKMQQQIAAAQQELARTSVQGSAGGGLVNATMSGTGDLLGLVISPEVVDPADTETLADLVVAAVRDAARAANDLAQTMIGPVSGGLPGLGS